MKTLSGLLLLFMLTVTNFAQISGGPTGGGGTNIALGGHVTTGHTLTIDSGATFTCAGGSTCSTGTPAFSAITGGTNTTAAMAIGVGGSFNFNATFLSFTAMASAPATPANGNIDLFGMTTLGATGFTRLNFRNESGVVGVLGRDNQLVVYNGTGSTMPVGTPVYVVSGNSSNIPVVGLAQANAISTMPAIGLTIQNILASSFGVVEKFGILGNLNTSTSGICGTPTCVTGGALFVSPTTAGTLTATRPVAPNFAQVMGKVLYINSSGGGMEVSVQSNFGNHDSGTDQANFSATQFTGALVGNADTATNLASYPAACTGANFSQGLSSGSNNCAQPSNVTGNAATATTATTATNAVRTGANGQTIALGDCDPMDLTTYCLVENFGSGGTSGSVSTTSVGQLGWALYNTTGTSTVTVSAASALPFFSWISINSQAVITDGGLLYLQPSIQIGTLSNWDSISRWAFGSATNGIYRVGMMLSPSAAGVPTGEVAVLRFDPSLRSLATATYGSAGTGTAIGATNDTCNVAIVGGMGTAVLTLTGTNSFTGGALTSLFAGTGYNATTPTKGILSNGTGATCAGTINLTSTVNAANSGPDAAMQVCTAAAGSSIEVCSNTGVNADTSYHKLRIRAIASANIGVTLDAGSEITICAGACTIPQAPSSGSVQLYGFLVLSNLGTTAESLLANTFRFKASGLTF